jgi:hypothetical protein
MLTLLHFKHTGTTGGGDLVKAVAAAQHPSALYSDEGEGTGDIGHARLVSHAEQTVLRAARTYHGPDKIERGANSKGAANVGDPGEGGMVFRREEEAEVQFAQTSASDFNLAIERQVR